MNLIVGFLILACLIGSEFVGSQSVDNVWPRLFAVLATVAAIPCLAFLQTRILLNKFENEEINFRGRQSLCRRMTATHSIAWLSAGLAIIWAIRWQDVVRGTWNLDAWPLLDEMVILAPIIFSMVASWAVFYELQLAIDDQNEIENSTDPNRDSEPGIREKLATHWARIEPRIGFVSIRFRLYFLLILIPISAFVLIRDCSTFLPSIPADWIAYLALPILVCIMLLFPFLTMFIWKTESIDDPVLREKLTRISRAHQLNVWAIRVWKTGDQIVNAAVAGFLPRFRVILMSDGLLKMFPEKEIEAVIRHEAGHIRLWHLPTRLFFLLVPVIALAIGDARFDPLNNPQDWLPVLAMTVAYITYFYLVTRWLSHQMEFEADIYSIEVSRANGLLSVSTSACPERSENMRMALLRLAAISPEQYENNGLFHPSIKRRIEFIDEVISVPQRGEKFRQSFARRRWILGFVLTLAVMGFYFLF